MLCGGSAEPLLRGGTGSASRSREMPAELPDRLEVGTHNMPGIAGLLEGLRFVGRRGIDRIARHEQAMICRAAEQMEKMGGVRLYRCAVPEGQSGVLSFTAEGRNCEEIGEALAERGIAVRAGLHCAPLAHQTAGTLDTGTVRLSPSVFTGPEQIDRFCSRLQQIFRESARF